MPWPLLGLIPLVLGPVIGLSVKVTFWNVIIFGPVILFKAIFIGMVAAGAGVAGLASGLAIGLKNKNEKKKAAQLREKLEEAKKKTNLEKERMAQQNKTAALNTNSSKSTATKRDGAQFSLVQDRDLVSLKWDVGADYSSNIARYYSRNKARSVNGSDEDFDFDFEKMMIVEFNKDKDTARWVWQGTDNGGKCKGFNQAKYTVDEKFKKKKKYDKDALRAWGQAIQMKIVCEGPPYPNSSEIVTGDLSGKLSEAGAEVFQYMIKDGGFGDLMKSIGK